MHCALYGQRLQLLVAVASARQNTLSLDHRHGKKCSQGCIHVKQKCCHPHECIPTSDHKVTLSCGGSAGPKWKRKSPHPCVHKRRIPYCRMPLKLWREMS